MRKAYSGRGDSGVTTDFSGKKIRKDHPRIAAGGKLDLLLSAMDLARLREKGETRGLLALAQEKLRQIAAEIAGAEAARLAAPATAADVARCAAVTDALGEPPQRFIRFDTDSAVALNECRLRCRELEIALVKLLRAGKLRRPAYAYVNRLSSLFFMLAYRRTKRRP